jgi:hypothetical protein
MAIKLQDGDLWVKREQGYRHTVFKREGGKWVAHAQWHLGELREACESDNLVKIEDRPPLATYTGIYRRQQEYILLNRALAGVDCLESYWQDECEELLECYPRLSTQRAGELAAAYQAILAAREWAALEQEVQTVTEECPATRMYDFLVQRSVREELAAISKSRTIIADSDKIERIEQRSTEQHSYVRLWKALYDLAEQESRP